MINGYSQNNTHIYHFKKSSDTLPKRNRAGHDGESMLNL